MISNPRVRVILNAVKDLAVDSAAFIKSQRGMLRAAQDDIIAKGKATKSHSFVNLKIQSSQPTLMLRVGVIVYVAPSAHRAPRGAIYFIAPDDALALITLPKVGIQLTVDHTKLHPHRWWHYVGRR